MKIWIWTHHNGTGAITSERIGSLTSLQSGGAGKVTLRRSFIAVTYAMAIILASSNLLTPLYATYQRIFHFSPLTLTLIFATYVVTLIPALLLFGPLADAIGRRPLLLAALFSTAVATLLLVLAPTTSWLFAARAFQGLGVGMLSGAGSAALIELGGDTKRAALVASAGVTGGAAAGALMTGILAQYAPAPLTLSYLVSFGLLVLAMLGVLSMVEPLPRAQRRPWRPHLPQLPPARWSFLLATAVYAVAVGVSALFLTFIPSFVTTILHITNLAVAVAPVAIFFFLGASAEILLRKQPARRSAVIGLLLLVCGLLALLFAGPTQSTPLLLIAAVFGGIGQGLAFMGSLALAGALAPQDRRGSILATYYAIVYVAFGGTAIGVGWLATFLDLNRAVQVFAVVIGSLCIITMVLLLYPSRQTQPRSEVTPVLQNT
jgi:MFS family permease